MSIIFISSSIKVSGRDVKEELESEANQKASMSQTYSSTDTNSIVAAMLFGKGLKSTRRQDSQPTMAQQQRLIFIFKFD
jgi:C4-dicarboxylate transporter